MTLSIVLAPQMTNPAIQNDFSYYRRTISRMRINNVSVRTTGVETLRPTLAPNRPLTVLSLLLFRRRQEVRSTTSWPIACLCFMLALHRC